MCARCNRGRTGLTLVEGASGFKNNGACLVTLAVALQNKRANPVRG